MLMKSILPVLILVVLQSCSHALGRSTDENKGEPIVANDWIVQDLIEKWKGNKKYMLAVLEAMPAEHYDFKVTEDVRSFGEQAEHIINGFSYQWGPTELAELPKVDAADKASLIASYERTFNAILAQFETIDGSSLNAEAEMWYGPSTKLRNLNLMDNHMAHHRGQMVVYLRMKGIKPPRYIGW